MAAGATAHIADSPRQQALVDWLVEGGGKDPFVVLVAAQPDDESVGAGGRLDRLRHGVFVYLTDGSPRDLGDARRAGYSSRESYAAARREELAQALDTAGVDRSRIHCLNSVDQEACFHLASLALGLCEILRAAPPDLVLTHAYEGGHPDHDATAFAAHAARALCPGSRSEERRVGKECRSRWSP